MRESVESFLERERGQLPPWFVVGFGTGIAAWFRLDRPLHWAAFLCLAAGLAIAGFSSKGGRLERSAGWFGLAMMLGCALVWARSYQVAAPRIERPLVTEFQARVERVETHSTAWARRMFHRRDEGFPARLGRALLALVATGLAVEIALIPIALYHFHKSGLYGVFANIVAIPLTTFVIMPLEAGALLLDTVGLGRPMWWLAGLSLDALLGLAHFVADSRGAVAMMAAMPPWTLGTMIAGGLWLCLWTTPPRLLGLAPILFGAVAAALSPRPDLLVTGDGRHLAIVDRDGTPLLLRERSGEFIRSIIADSAGFDDEPEPLASRSFASCSSDSCIALLERGARRWQILATRSAQSIEWQALVRACAEADIVVSSRWLPRGCTPRWLKLDRDSLARTGGVAVYLGDEPRTATVAERIGEHPWAADIPELRRYGPRVRTGGGKTDAPIRDRT